MKSIVVIDRHGRKWQIFEQNILSVQHGETRKIQDKEYPQITIHLRELAGSEDFSSYADFVEVTGDQALAVSKFFLSLEHTVDFTQHPTAEQVHQHKSILDVKPQTESSEVVPIPF